MWNLITPLKKYVSVKDINPSNNVFKLHCKVTVYMLVFATVLLSAKQYFGDPIDCIVGNSKVEKSTINNWCWMMGAWIPKNVSTYSESFIWPLFWFFEVIIFIYFSENWPGHYSAQYEPWKFPRKRKTLFELVSMDRFHFGGSSLFVRIAVDYLEDLGKRTDEGDLQWLGWEFSIFGKLLDD